MDHLKSRQRLKYIYKTLLLTEDYSTWSKSLPTTIGRWTDSLDFFNRVESAVKEHLKDKVINFKNAVPSLVSVPEGDVFDAIVNNWPEALPRIRGKRSEILICVAAHVANFVKIGAYKAALISADEVGLGRLGLAADLRRVLVKLLNACLRADNLFIRFLAFSHCPSGLPKGKTLEEMGASAGVFYSPEDGQKHTINALFPKETQYLARHLKEIAGAIDQTRNPELRLLQGLLIALGKAYSQSDIREIESEYMRVNKSFTSLMKSRSPLYIIPSGYFEGGYEKCPYHDPEIRIGLSSPQCAAIEGCIADIRRSLSLILKEKSLPRPQSSGR